MNEELAREYYVKIKTLRDHVARLTHSISELDSKTLELRSMIDAVTEAQDLEADQNILAKLTNGVMIEATSKPVEYVYLNVGAGTVVKKKPEEAITLFEEQQTELAEYRTKLITQRDELAAQAEAIEAEVEDSLDV